MHRLWIVAFGILGIASIALGETAAPISDSSGWSFAITPYLWAPSVDGSLRYSGGPATPEADVDHKSLINYLSGAFMLAGEVKKDRWVALTDFIYVDFEDTDSSVKGRTNIHTETSLSGKAWTLLGGYRVLEGPVELDVLGGVRYFGLEASTEWQVSAGGGGLPLTGTASDSTNVWDGLFALRGRIHPGNSRWFLPYYVDVGTGGSQLTWQAFGGAGYAFKWLELSLIYRTIYYNERDNGLMNNLSFTGPAAVFTFRF